MRKKLVLDVGALSVETFEIGAGAPRERGTVHAAGDACTCAASCACDTELYWCGEIPWTIHSCDFTRNASCPTG